MVCSMQVRGLRHATVGRRLVQRVADRRPNLYSRELCSILVDALARDDKKGLHYLDTSRSRRRRRPAKFRLSPVSLSHTLPVSLCLSLSLFSTRKLPSLLSSIMQAAQAGAITETTGNNILLKNTTQKCLWFNGVDSTLSRDKIRAKLIRATPLPQSAMTFAF